MSLTQFDPLASIRVFEDAFTRMVNEPRANRPWSPAVDIYETEDSIVIKAELPDVEQKDIEVRIEDNTLILKGERKHETDVKKENYHRIERYFGSFQRSFSLPATVRQENVSAVCDKGILTITMPKKEETKPKQINVQVK